MSDQTQSSRRSKPAPTAVDGFGRRDEAVERLHRKHPVLVRRLQRTFLALLLRDGPRTTDAPRLLAPIPFGVTPKVAGAAILPLPIVFGLIAPDGVPVASNRPMAHGRKIQRWKIRNRRAALSWLKAHPELPEPAGVNQ
jgi:hypothetical protein